MAGSPPPSSSTNVEGKSTKREDQARFVEMMAERVRRLAEGRFNATTLGEALGIPSSSAANYWSGKRPWPTEVVPDLANVLHTNVEALMASDGEPTVVADRKPGYRSQPIEPADDQVGIAVSDVAYGLGGAFVDDNSATTSVERFPRAFIRQFTRGPFSRLYFATGIGDSMEPTIHHSDLVLIDRSQEMLRVSDQLWALHAGSIAMIKRVRVMPDGVVLLVSDNPDVSDYRLGENELQLIGRVVAVVKRV